MARFDVYRLPGRSPLLVVDMQADLLSDLATRVVVPLAPVSAGRREDIPRLNPVLRVGDKDYYFKPTDIATLPKALLRDPIANIESTHRNDIVAAMDFLLQGF
jgi:toxin CcdB